MQPLLLQDQAIVTLLLSPLRPGGEDLMSTLCDQYCVLILRSQAGILGHHCPVILPHLPGRVASCEDGLYREGLPHMHHIALHVPGVVHQRRGMEHSPDAMPHKVFYNAILVLRGYLLHSLRRSKSVLFRALLSVSLNMSQGTRACPAGLRPTVHKEEKPPCSLIPVI